jgi:hypothetical protein
MYVDAMSKASFPFGRWVTASAVRARSVVARRRGPRLGRPADAAAARVDIYDDDGTGMRR